MDIRHHIIFLPQNKTNIRIQNLYMLRERPTSASAGREIGAPLQRERNREEEEQQQTRARGQNSGCARGSGWACDTGRTPHDRAVSLTNVGQGRTPCCSASSLRPHRRARLPPRLLHVLRARRPRHELLPAFCSARLIPAVYYARAWAEHPRWCSSPWPSHCL
jgi:hypothetical protein